MPYGGTVKLLPWKHSNNPLKQRFIHKPGAAQTSLAAPKTSGEDTAELEAPLADALVAHDDTALRQQILDISETETEWVIEPHGVGNDLRQLAVARVRIPRGVHAASISLPRLLPST